MSTPSKGAMKCASEALDEEHEQRQKGIIIEDEVAAEIIDRHVAPLVSALERIIKGRQDDPKDSNGISAGEISNGDLRQAREALRQWKGEQ